MTDTTADPDPASCSHGICLPLNGDGCHLADPTLTAEQVIERLGWPRHDLIAHMTRDSLDLGLYDTPASDYPPQDQP
ncbi:hypothetical protein ACIBCR_15000 [Micromonospora echinospora]|uniref:hypothetical protein n=1 Tax=Micromonospora echinospora TaxID=1877 RepID=UPI00379D9420